MARTGRFLLDTNIVIALFAKEAAVQQRLAEASEVFVPSIVLGELYYGARKSTRVTENLARIDEFVASSTVLPSDHRSAVRGHQKPVTRQGPTDSRKRYLDCGYCYAISTHLGGT